MFVDTFTFYRSFLKRHMNNAKTETIVKCLGYTSHFPSNQSIIKLQEFRHVMSLYFVLYISLLSFASSNVKLVYSRRGTTSI